MKEILGLILIIIVLWFLWFFTGGPQRAQMEQGKYMRPLPPVDTGDTY